MREKLSFVKKSAQLTLAMPGITVLFVSSGLGVDFLKFVTKSSAPGSIWLLLTRLLLVLVEFYVWTGCFFYFAQAIIAPRTRLGFLAGSRKYFLPLFLIAIYTILVTVPFMIPALLYRIYVVRTWTVSASLLYRLSFIVPSVLTVYALPCLYVLDRRGSKAFGYAFKFLRNRPIETCIILCVVIVGDLLAFSFYLIKPTVWFGNYWSFSLYSVDKLISTYAYLIVFLAAVELLRREGGSLLNKTS